MAKRKTVTQRDPLGKLQSIYEEEEEQDDGIVADGARVRVPMWAMDALQRDVAQHAGKPLVTDGTGNPLALHRPGFRYSTDMAQRQAADAALAQAYQEVEQRDANAWRCADEDGAHPLLVNKRGLTRAKEEGDGCSIDGQRGTWVREGDRLVCKPGKQDSVADAYAAYDREAEATWRNS